MSEETKKTRKPRTETTSVKATLKTFIESLTETEADYLRFVIGAQFNEPAKSDYEERSRAGIKGKLLA